MAKKLITHCLLVQIVRKPKPTSWYNGLKGWVFSVVPFDEDDRYYKVLSTDNPITSQALGTSYLKPPIPFTTPFLIHKSDAMYIGRVAIIKKKR